MTAYSLHTGNRMQVSALVILFLSIGTYVFTGNIAVLAIPFIALYLVLFAGNWKLAYWVMLFCIPLSIQLNFANDSLSVSAPDEPMMWLNMLLFAMLIAQRPGRIPRWWFLNPAVLIIILQFIWLLVAVRYSQVPFLSIKFLAAKIWMLSCFLIIPVWIFKGKKDYRTAFILFLIPVCITVFVVLLRQTLNGFSFQEINSAICPLYANHVEYGAILSVFLPLVITACYLSERRNRKWLLTAILFLVIALILSYSRSAILAMIFAGLVALAIRLRLVNFVMPFFYGLIALTLVYMVNNNKYIDFRPNYEQTYMHKGFADHIIATFRGKDMSSMERLHRWIAAVRMSKDKPLTGYGPHAFYYYYKPYTSLLFRTYVSRNEEHSTTHNYFLYVLVEQGWPAMLLYALLIMAVFAMAQKIYHRFTDKFYKGCTLGLTAAFAACFINNFFSELIETDKTGSMFYLTIAMLVLLDRKSRELTDIGRKFESVN